MQAEDWLLSWRDGKVLQPTLHGEALRLRVGLVLVDFQAQLEQIVAVLAVAAEGLQIVGGCQRIGIDAYAHSSCPGSSEQVKRLVRDHQVRRLNYDVTASIFNQPR